MQSPYIRYTSTIHLLYIYYTFTMHLLYIHCTFTMHLLYHCYAFTTGGDGDSGMDLHPTNMKWHGIPCHKRQWGSTPTVRAPKARAERGGGGARPVVIWRWGRNALAPSSTNLILHSAQGFERMVLKILRRLPEICMIPTDLKCGSAAALSRPGSTPSP